MSTITESDWVEIVATLRAVDNPDFQCQVCLGDPGGEARVQNKRQSKACSELREQPLWDFDGVSFRTCIGNFVSESVFTWLSAFQKYREGVLPFGGSFFDQPAKAIELFTAFEGHFQRKIEAEQKKQAAKQMTRGRGGRR